MSLAPKLSRRDDHDHTPQVSMYTQFKKAKGIKIFDSDVQAGNVASKLGVATREQPSHRAMDQFMHAEDAYIQNSRLVAGDKELDANNIPLAVDRKTRQYTSSFRLLVFLVCLLSWLLYKYS